MSQVECPVCYPIFGGIAQRYTSSIDGSAYDCNVCGRYNISRTLETIDLNAASDHRSARDRAIISHMIRLGSDRGSAAFLTTNSVNDACKNSKLPTPMGQLSNLVREIGKHQQETGEPRLITSEFGPRLGCINKRSLGQVCKAGVDRGLIQKNGSAETNNPLGGVIINSLYELTFDGWQYYEEEQKGRFSGSYGFLALKFNDEVLSKVCSDYLKPGIKKELGYDLIDLRDVPQAGIIDNIMREHIRDSAFVLADLTHDNPGAYWEAGYAEGLGKPVVYLCEEGKFEKSKTHFDTNHCTTEFWKLGSETQFVDRVVATLSRSLGLGLRSSMEPAE